MQTDFQDGNARLSIVRKLVQQHFVMSTTIHQKGKNFGQDQRYQTIVSTYNTNFIYIFINQQILFW